MFSCAYLYTYNVRTQEVILHLFSFFMNLGVYTHYVICFKGFNTSNTHKLTENREMNSYNPNFGGDTSSPIYPSSRPIAEEDRSTITVELARAYDAIAAVIIFAYERMDFRRVADFEKLCAALDSLEDFLGLDPAFFCEIDTDGTDEQERIELLINGLADNYNEHCPNTDAIVSTEFCDMISRLERRYNFLSKKAA